MWNSSTQVGMGHAIGADGKVYITARFLSKSSPASSKITKNRGIMTPINQPSTSGSQSSSGMSVRSVKKIWLSGLILIIAVVFVINTMFPTSYLAGPRLTSLDGLFSSSRKFILLRTFCLIKKKKKH